MKTKIVVLASVLLVLAALTFLVPVGVLRATMETKSCPGPMCIINNANIGAQGPEGTELHFCYGANGEQCDYCCNFDPCGNYEKIVGQCGHCIQDDEYNINCLR